MMIIAKGQIIDLVMVKTTDFGKRFLRKESNSQGTWVQLPLKSMCRKLYPTKEKGTA